MACLHFSWKKMFTVKTTHEYIWFTFFCLIERFLNSALLSRSFRLFEGGGGGRGEGGGLFKRKKIPHFRKIPGESSAVWRIDGERRTAINLSANMPKCALKLLLAPTALNHLHCCLDPEKAVAARCWFSRNSLSAYAQ